MYVCVHVCVCVSVYSLSVYMYVTLEDVPCLEFNPSDGVAQPCWLSEFLLLKLICRQNPHYIHFGVDFWSCSHIPSYSVASVIMEQILLVNAVLGVSLSL